MTIHRRRRSGPRAQCRGLTLIELLTTLAILAIGLVGVSSMFVVAFKQQRHAHYASVASGLANRALEEMRSAGYNGITETLFPPTQTVTDLPSGQTTISWEAYPDTTSANQYKVTVVVSWGGGPGIAGRVTQVAIISNHG